MCTLTHRPPAEWQHVCPKPLSPRVFDSPFLKAIIQVLFRGNSGGVDHEEGGKRSKVCDIGGPAEETELLDLPSSHLKTWRNVFMWLVDESYESMAVKPSVLNSVSCHFQLLAHSTVVLVWKKHVCQLTNLFGSCFITIQWLNVVDVLQIPHEWMNISQTSLFLPMHRTGD